MKVIRSFLGLGYWIKWRDSNPATGVLATPRREAKGEEEEEERQKA